MTVFPNGKHDDQVDSTAQFLDWFKRPFPGQGFYELTRMRAQELEHRNRPEPAKPNWAIGSMEWQAEQRGTEAARSTLRGMGLVLIWIIGAANQLGRGRNAGSDLLQVTNDFGIRHIR